MLLVIDVGNSNTVVGVWDGDNLVEHWRVETQASRTADEYRLVLHDLMSLSSVKPDAIDTGIVASVVPPLTPVFCDAVERSFGFVPLVVGPGLKTGMRIHYDNPREVGADRIANAVAAFEEVGGAVVVVDFGTATTFDAIAVDGSYLGGAIAPGVGIAADALARRTAKLPRVELARPSRVIGKNPIGSIQSGTFFGYVGLVDGMVTRVRAEMTEHGEVQCLATGGLAGLFATESRQIDAVDPWLTLKGLRILHARNVSGG